MISGYNESPEQIFSDITNMQTTMQTDICKIRMDVEQNIPRTLWQVKGTNKERSMYMKFCDIKAYTLRPMHQELALELDFYM